MYGSLTKLQCCGQILQDIFETYKTFPQCIKTEFDFIVNVFRIGFFKLLNNDDEKFSKTYTVN